MKQKEILYAAYRDKWLEEGLSYAIYLANQLGAGLRVVLLENDGLARRFEDVMTAITFAEAGEHDTARDFMNAAEEDTGAASVHAYLSEKCKEAGVKVNVHSGFADMKDAVKGSLKGKNIDLVLLSPSVTKSGGALKRILKGSMRPVVTMVR